MNEGFHRGAREGGADRPGGVAGAPRSPRGARRVETAVSGTQVARRGTTHQAEGPPVALGPVRSALAGPEPNTVHSQRWKETGLRPGGGQCGASQVAGGRVSFRFRISKPPSPLK